MKPQLFRPTGHISIYTYFFILILIGTLILSMPFSWSGENGHDRALPIDAVFTAISAVSVTGLATVDTTQWSRVGQIAILFLIQFGGLGIITFAMLYLFLPGSRMSLKNTQYIRKSFFVEASPSARPIVRGIVLTTLLIESVGALLLALRFHAINLPSPGFNAVFHSISAFCNAGFSTLPGGLVNLRGDLIVNLVIMTIVILGGLGFMVLIDIAHHIRKKRRYYRYHSRVTFIAVPLFILTGFLGYFLLDNGSAYNSLSPGERVLASLFQSVTARTAGFNTMDQAALSPVSQMITMFLMFVGGGSGSVAGGIKVTTAFIIILAVFRGTDENGSIRFLRRGISASTVSRATLLCFKALAMLCAAIFALILIEAPGKTGMTLSSLIFESVSALATVGLSVGITPHLSTAGKIVVGITMLAGRLGMFALLVRVNSSRTENIVKYPNGEVLTG